VPWLLVAASAVLAALLLSVVFAAYLPATQHIARLEAELKEVYGREAALQNRLAQQEQAQALREQQLKRVIAERDALQRRVEATRREAPPTRAPARRR
jgi:septal ring factor EnvC (AmiA/AmiB activator)